uniref:Methyltransferase n=1 Tax=Caenorhabditis tropicalis TaxID=1561998 RepID=A0A1I7TXR5_9PELO
MIDEMMKNLKPHEDVFPVAPKPGDIVIPIGGLAKCMCSPGCTKELPQPAYQIIGDLEENKRSIEEIQKLYPGWIKVSDEFDLCFQFPPEMFAKQRK